jgi:hypothetical protein
MFIIIIIIIIIIILQAFSVSLCDLAVRVPGYTKEMYCASCEVRTKFKYVM